MAFFGLTYAGYQNMFEEQTSVSKAELDERKRKQQYDNRSRVDPACYNIDRVSKFYPRYFTYDKKKTAKDIKDPFVQYREIITENQNYGWWRGNLATGDVLQWANKPYKPLRLSETSQWAQEMLKIYPDYMLFV